MARTVSKAAKAVSKYVDKAWKSPIGIVAGILAFVVTAIVLIATAPISIPAILTAIGTAAFIGAATNLVVGAVDVATGGEVGQDVRDWLGSKGMALAESLRNGYLIAGFIADIGIGALAVAGFLREGLTIVGEHAAAHMAERGWTESMWRKLLRYPNAIVRDKSGALHFITRRGNHIAVKDGEIIQFWPRDPKAWNGHGGPRYPRGRWTRPLGAN